MWFDIIKHMVNYYSNLSNFSDVSIEGGTDGRKPSSAATIYVLRNMETDIDFHQRSKGTVSLWIECWVRNDSKVPIDAYESLSQLETMFLEAFPDWTKQVGTDLGKIATKITIPHFVGDADRLRPLCGSQASILINWKR